MNTNNSISNSLKKLLELNTNSLKTFERINEAVTTEQKSIPLEILTDEGTKIVTIPGFGFMQKELTRLDTNLKALTGLGKGTTRIKLPDGTFQNIITSALKSPANDFTAVARPINFSTAPNYFAEDFLNPMLKTSFDVSGQIPNDTERVLVKRIIFDSSNQTAVNWFNENYRNQENVDYLTATRDVVNNNIAYIVDEELRDMPYRTGQYTGKFDVINISNSQREVLENGVTVKQAIKLYTLDKLTYSDKSKDLDQTELLRVGDELMVIGGSKNTRYRIDKLDSSSRQVELRLIEGYEPIKIGALTLAIYKNEDNNLQIEIPCGFNERVLMFMKAIDADSKLLAENWSPGVGYYTNELTLTQEDGVKITLAEYYKENVADFSRMIDALKVDSIPPAAIGVSPDAPVLDSENFKVVQVNTHLSSNDAKGKITKLSADKITVDESVKKLDSTISKKRGEISTKKYESAVQRDKDKSELNSLVEERVSEAKMFSSIVNQIQSVSTDTNVKNISPKYRIRGFWSIPNAKKVADTADQEVVQFIVAYRYLSTSGKSGEAAQLKFKEEGREKTAVFSNWIEKKTKVRPRAKSIAPDGSVSTKFTWQPSKVEDGQEINFNQLDIAISQGETVEIRIKSISEAGYPQNPIVSDWSESMTVAFPEAEIDTADIAATVEANLAELARVRMNEELTAQGIYTHVGDSFTANESYYAHTATNIASGFLTGEQKPISVYDKIAELEAMIAGLKVEVEAEVGELVVKIIDEDGTVTNIAKDQTVQLFAGYYINEVADLTIRKGHIVNKTFNLVLENSKATKLELVSKLVGDRNKAAYRSSTNGSTEATNGFGLEANDSGGQAPDRKIESDTYYLTEGKYDLAPIQYQNVDSSNIEHTGDSPYQSMQRRGQFVYSRYMDVANQNPHYIVEPLETATLPYDVSDYEHQLSYDSAYTATNGANDFIWAGSFTNLTPNDVWDPSYIDTTGVSNITLYGYNRGLYLHKDHPLLENVWEDAAAASNLDLAAVKNSAIFSMPKTATQASGATLFSFFGYNSALTSARVGNKQQTAFHNGEGLSMATVGDDLGRPVKMSFEENDQYLLGGRSCGAFLYMNPINLETLKVGGDTRRSKKEIKPKKDNSSNAVSVEVVFQYRMTDYFGNNEELDNGRIGGFARLAYNNLTYTKKIGFDIFDKFGEQFSFDLEVFAKYSPKGKNRNSIKAAQLTRDVVSSPVQSWYTQVGVGTGRRNILQ
jgi:hypothetical protein|tara:strand:+ start:824 stop:4525 length:3702 start_codon:yes stop_codon:yes gene_type:complete